MSVALYSFGDVLFEIVEIPISQKKANAFSIIFQDVRIKSHHFLLHRQIVLGLLFYFVNPNSLIKINAIATGTI